MTFVRRKLSVFLTSFGLLALAALTLLALKSQIRQPLIFQASSDELTPFLQTFREFHRPLVEINFTDLYAGAGQFHILHPLLNILSIQYRQEHPACDDSEVFEKLVREKNGVDEANSASQGARKSAALTKFLRGQSQLPTDFIRIPPLIDEQGNSYAYLLSELGPAPFNDKSWVEQNLSFFKTEELRKVLPLFQITDRRFKIIANLTENEMGDIVKGLPLILTSEYLFIKDESRLGFSPLSYWVYDSKEMRASLANGKYELSVAGTDSLCLQKLGNACWTYNSRQTLAYLNRYSTVIIVLIALLLASGFVMFLRNRYVKNRAQAKSRLALQVLSHEFRTPVASMLLQIEQLPRSAALSEAHADLLTGISSEVFKLQRIIEISKTYLQTGNHRLHFNQVVIPSLNQWLLDFVHESRFKPEYRLLETDAKVSLDPFWLKFVLSSLVDNAFAHGAPPVVIRLHRDGKKIRVSVEDNGQCEFTSIHEMTDAFVKSRRSSGMGLGLNITKYVLDEWNGKLEFSTVPTAFTLTLESF